MMRVTVNLPYDVLRTSRSLANRKGISLGDALAELARAGLKPAARLNTEKPFPCFVVKERAKRITLAKTLRAEDEL
jgi:hypothetical protein